MAGTRPIGWWIKRLDALLEQAVDSAVAAEDLTRRHWQVLHSVADGAGSERGLRATLVDFPGDVGAVLDDLVERGWVDRSDSGLALTAAGGAAHDRVAATVGGVRRHVTDGLSAVEYEQTVRTLGRMAENLERLLATDRPPPAA